MDACVAYTHTSLGHGSANHSSTANNQSPKKNDDDDDDDNDDDDDGDNHDNHDNVNYNIN